MELIDLTRIFFALIAVIGMIGLLAVIARKAGFSSGGVSFSQRKRLAMVETLALDARRRVAIIRCDDREHLILLSANSETVIDRNLPTPAEEEIDSSQTQNFGEAMKKLQDLGRGANPFAQRYAEEKTNRKDNSQEDASAA